MTISSTTNRVSYTGNGATVDFSFPYYFLANADLVVIKRTIADGTETLQTLTTDYTVAGAGVSAGGTVTMVSAPSSAYQIVIYRDPAITQSVDLVENDPLPVEDAVEKPLDKLTMICQRLADRVSRAFRLSDGDTSGASTTLPTPEASKVIGWDAAGTALKNYGAVDNTLLALQLAASSGSSLVEFISDALAAAAITIQTALRQRYWTEYFRETGDTDDEVLAKAIASGKPLAWSPRIYTVTESVAVTDVSALDWWGNPNSSFVKNNASAGKPTFVFTDTQHANIRGVVPIGEADYPNDGYLFTTAGGQTCAFITMRDVPMQPNGNGIEMRKVNTLRFYDVSYWQSGSNGSGATADAGERAHGIFVDDSITGNYANEISITGGNILDVDHTISGHASIYAKAGSGGSLQNWTVLDVELEGSGSVAFNIAGAYNFRAEDNFTENTTATITDSRFSAFENNYNMTTLTMAGSCVQVMVRDSTLENGGLVIGASCDGCGAENSNLGTLSDAGTGSTFVNCTASGGTPIPDKIGRAGIIERDRTVPLGAFTTPAFDSGDFTAATGDWTVASGDAITYAYTLVGKMLTLMFYLDSTTVSATPAYLSILIPGGHTAAKRTMNPIIVTDNSSTKQLGAAFVLAGATDVRLYSSAAFGAWATSTDATSVFGQISFEIV